MPRFKHYNYDQDAMVVINYQEQLQPGTFEHAVHYLIEYKLDLSVFHRSTSTKTPVACPAIRSRISPPWRSSSAATRMRLKCCFSRCCWSVMCRVLGNELFTIDGCKMSSNAAKEWSGTFKELGEKRDKLKRLVRYHLTEHYARDEAETEAELDRDICRAKTMLSLDKAMTCICLAGKSLYYEGIRSDQNGAPRAHFQGRLLQCRPCRKKHQCI